MKLIIYGAASATGKLIIERALAASYEVTTFVRDQSRLGMQHEKLTVICGDALNVLNVESAVEGSDALPRTLGPKGKPVVMAAEATKNIISAMEKHRVNHLVVVSLAGITVSQDKRGFYPIGALIKILLKEVFTDRENQVAVSETSKVHWIAVRVPRLPDGSATGSFKLFIGKASPGMKVTCRDLAAFVLKQLTEDRWSRQAPILRN